jgi:hypothetical protein
MQSSEQQAGGMQWSGKGAVSNAFRFSSRCKTGHALVAGISAAPAGLPVSAACAGGAVAQERRWQPQ